MALVLDTGPLLAAIDHDDAHHAACADLIGATGEELLIPAPVLPELDYLLRQRVGTAAMPLLLDEIQRGAFRLLDLNAGDYSRVGELLRDYTDLGVGFVDAAVLAIVERLNERKLATLDHRHFSVMRPRHVDSLELLPVQA